MKHFNSAITLLLFAALMLELLAGCGKYNESNPLPNTTPIETGQSIANDGTIAETEDNSEDSIIDAAAPENNEDNGIDAAIPESSEQSIKTEQLRSFSMMYYLAITAEEIRTSKDNRLILDEIYTSLLNDINPGAVDEITQDHLKNLRDIIKDYILIATKRERLQFIYNQQKASAIKSAVPNPLAILSLTNAFDWKRLAVTVAYAAVDSFTSYRNAGESAENSFLMSGWELDDEEVAAVQKNRDRAFDYMVDMVQEYQLDGMLTLSEKAIEKYAEICAIESVPERIRRLTSEESTYQLLGNYWLELADCYFETDQFEKCLECVEKYKELATGIYRKDFNYAKILPKAIASAQNIYSGEEYVSIVSGFAKALLDNTSTEDWSSRYFVAQVFLDLYSKTSDNKYLEDAYQLAYDNVTLLLPEQRTINKAYLDDVKEQVVKEPDYRFLSDQEKKEKEREYKDEKKRAKNYNNGLKKARKTELPSLYEPLVLNCELLFALADKLNISDNEKAEIEAILRTESNGIFLSKPVNDMYSFSVNSNRYSIEFTKDSLIIPADLLTAGATVTITVNEGDSSVTFEDCEVSEVVRRGKTIDTFVAFITSKQLKKYGWTADSEVTITTTFEDVYDKTVDYEFAVSDFQEHWYGDKVVFEQK